MNWQNIRNWYNPRTTVGQKLIGTALWGLMGSISAVSLMLWQNAGVGFMVVVTFIALVITVILALAKLLEAMIQIWMEGRR